jgi:hypothetical protein
MAFDPKKYGATPVQGFDPSKFGAIAVPTPTPIVSDPLATAAHITDSIFGGGTIGEADADVLIGLKQLLSGDVKGFNETAASAPHIPALIGDFVKAGTNVFGAGSGAAKTLLGTLAQFGGLGAAGAIGQGLTDEKDAGQIAKEALVSGGIGAALGGTFNLLAKAASKAGPSVLSFTSGVPRQSIEQAAANPEVAKQGLHLSLDEIHTKATSALQGLYNDLGKEFEGGLKDITSTTGQTKGGVAYNQQGFIKAASTMRQRLSEYSRDFAREFRLGTKASPEGILINFDKSPITKPGEQRAVQETFKTISTWDDFSAKGLQDLAERVGSLRNFESGAKTESSAIVSKIYNKITGAGGQADHGLISKYYPELHTLRSNYHANRNVLDEIQNVLNATSEKPTQIQGAVSRLDKLFAENRETYLNVIRQLGERSGTDFLSLIAGTDFQKVLPNFVRGLGGGAAVGVGASALNPWLVLLSPLFSPRATGVIVRNAPKAANAAAKITKAAAAPISEAANKK